MPLRSQDPLLRFGQQIQTESTAPEEFGAMFDEALQSGPVGSLLRMQEIDEAEHGVQQSASSVARFGQLPTHNPDSPKLSQADALQRLKDAGLDSHLQVPVGGIRERTLSILMERKRDELRRQTILAQSPGGAGRVSARVAGGLVGSLVDPANIALAFVPVVGEARYAQLLARAGGIVGRTGVRMAIGGAEGVVGAAIAEPLNYAANAQQQADYDAYDAMTNIAGGLFFGSALHAGAGLFGDMLRPGRWAQAPHRVEPGVEPGRVTAPGIEPPVARPDPLQFDPLRLAEERERAIVLDRLAEGRPLTREHALARATEGLRADIEGDLLARSSGVAESGHVAAARAELAAVTRELDAFDAAHQQRIRDINQRPGVTRKQAESLAREQSADLRADLLARKARAEALISANKAGSDAVATLSAFRKGEVPEHWRGAVEAEADRLLGSDGQQSLSAAVRTAIEQDPFGSVRPFLAHLPPDVQQGAFRMAMAQALSGRPVDVLPAVLAHHGDVDGAAAAALRNADEVAGADRFAAAAADARLKDVRADDPAALQEAANEAEGLWREQAKAAGMDDDEIADALEEGTQAVKDANRYAQAVKIAALCMLRAG